MSICPETTQLRTIGCDIDISPPVATTFMSFCNHALQLHMFRSEVYVQFSRMSFFSRMYLRFVHLTSFPSSMRKSYLLARLIFQPLRWGVPLYYLSSVTHNSIEVYHLILTYFFLDIMGEAIDADQRPQSQYAIEKLRQFIFNLIYRDIDI